ncbi:MAG: hypothetical protein COZ12_03070 [Deltaproteobacteria bacterium CG_4_10_14_3_um_filter_60_8]|nr:MAG: hypothetical protein AUK28_01345 [Desulfobacterales bacterium CG2_30_60_27]PIY22487.1 MAG: hypothetical protein COZ12_03070 [Deltaproteobacteria bacterium CG_4_10_14_3_um_filter_60_8]
MTIKQSTPFANDNAGQICFGLNRPVDEQSLALFLQRFARPELLTALAPRLADEEISRMVDLLSGLLRAHLTDQEYHRLFLGD